MLNLVYSKLHVLFYEYVVYKKVAADCSKSLEVQHWISEKKEVYRP